MITETIEQYKARGGVIHKAPPAFAAPTFQARALTRLQRKAIRAYTEAQELKRQGKMPLRMELRNGKESGSQDFQIQWSNACPA